MADRFYFLDEPTLLFGAGQESDDPRDGLALFGPADPCGALPSHVAIGTPRGLDLWDKWVDSLNSPAACVDVGRQRPWPPYPGYDIAFGAIWPRPVKRYTVELSELETAARLKLPLAVSSSPTTRCSSHVPSAALPR